MLRELRPAGLVLINEYGRTEWLAGARMAGVPVFAVQHGIIYPWHLGYRHPRRPGIPIADRTFLFGDYERRVLLEDGGYLPDEVEVTGAPRIDAVRRQGGADPAGAAAERADVRRELGVAPDDRLLVISTTHERLHRRYYWMHALAAVLDGDLPNVHLVFKQHPAEADEGPYRALVAGLAAAAGRSVPPMTVVRDMDLFRLLRASDAHLGLFSTVLTDAVVTGTPNLVAMTQAHRDLLGYVDAGVARPVHDAASLLAALDHPVVADAAARDRFLEDHFRSGDASARIRDALLAATSPAGAPDGAMPVAAGR
jgi:UDP-N-acetylglucosamine 2-epimerase